MTTLSLVWILAGLHVIGDFVLQTPWMAENKSHNNLALTTHALVYTLAFTPLFFMFAMTGVITFLAVNFVLHWVVDDISSTATAWLWREKRTHDFFVVIGLDQFIHLIVVSGTAYAMFFMP